MNQDAIDSIRHSLREGRSPSLSRRRRIAALSVLGLVDFGAIALYQTGVLRKLPDIPGSFFDSNQVNASRKAYALGVPDGATGALLYALNLVLASAGGDRASGRRPIFSLLLGGAVAAGALGAGQYLYHMAARQQRACPYCIAGALFHFAMVPLVAPELKEAVSELRGRR